MEKADGLLQGRVRRRVWRQESREKQQVLRWVVGFRRRILSIHSFIHSADIPYAPDRQKKVIPGISQGWHFVMGVTTHRDTTQGRNGSEACERQHVSKYQLPPQKGSESHGEVFPKGFGTAC